MTGEKKLFCYQKKQVNAEAYDLRDLRDLTEKVVKQYAMLDGENTNPGFVVVEHPPPYELYVKAVREIVSLKTVEEMLQSPFVQFRGYKNQRGLIGATAATAWTPTKDKTYEIIAYREKNRWGTKRFVDEESVKFMDKTCPSTFNNYDYDNRHNTIVPNSPCPVLYGIRGDDPQELYFCRSLIQSESVEGWLIFETNQGTDDHLQRKRISEIKPYQSVIVQGCIIRNPVTIDGGHVIFSISDKSKECIDCAAYEPTKEFREIIRQLRVGDVVEVYGGVRDIPRTVNVEKINILRLEDVFEKVENPVCPVCGKHMKSQGKNRGYRCRRCGQKSDTPIVKKRKRSIHTGFYEVPVCARRHLSKPLKRMKIGEVFEASI